MTLKKVKIDCDEAYPVYHIYDKCGYGKTVKISETNLKIIDKIMELYDAVQDFLSWKADKAGMWLNKDYWGTISGDI
jgi:hypothetical protein